MTEKKSQMGPFIDPLLWLNSHEIYPKYFWKSKHQDFCTACLGSSYELSSFEEVEESEHFINAAIDFNLDFSKSRLWIPKYEMIQKGSTTTFHSYGASDFPKEATKEIPEKNYVIEQSQTLPDFPNWSANLTSAQKFLEKVVLARKLRLFLNKKIDSLSLFSKLKKRSQSSHLFFYQPSQNIAFFGASPETLYQRNADLILSEAIAGTRKRGKTKKEDFFLEKDLLSHEKEKKEFQFVSDHIRSVFEKICAAFHFSPLNVIKTKWVQHLQMLATGKLNKAYPDATLLALFHPTPAVGGTPSIKALNFLKKTEPFARNFYASPIGRMSASYTELAVGIRSCYIIDNLVDVFAGTGIVKASQKDQEWQELQNKSNWIYEIL